MFLEENIPHSAANRILDIIRKHKIDETLPKDTRTLLGTPRSVTLFDVSPGKYIHFGLKYALEHNLQIYFNSIQVPDTIFLNFNIDGLPISNSSLSQFWPILASISQVDFHTEPFVIGIYHGNTKPDSNNEFLKLFVDELEDLLKSGIKFKNMNVKICVGAFICDAPARAFILNVKSHSGFSSCTKCTIHGEFYERRVIFPDLHCNLRTDTSFKLKQDKGHHHEKKSYLEKLDFGLVTHFPIDYMHLVCLGVMKKMLFLLTRGNISVRLHKEKLECLSSKLLYFKNCIPSEFARKPRSLVELERWKATEFRQFLLYTGPIILKDILPSEQYRHFMSFSIAIRILCLDNKRLYAYSHSLLEYFVENFEVFYNRENISYNVHGLLHLFLDVQQYGPLDNFSAFKYENALYKMKSKLRQTHKPLQQIHNRIWESYSHIPTKDVLINYPIVDTITVRDGYSTFKNIHFKNFMLSIDFPNNICIFNKSSIFEIICIEKNDKGVIVLQGKEFLNQELFLEKPNLSHLNIFLVNSDDFLYKCIPVTCIVQKCLKFSVDSKKFVTVPYIHHM